MLLDSNYAAQPENSALRQFIAEHSSAVSALSYIEVLGYHKLTKQERLYFENFFHASLILPISQEVLDRAVALRQTRKMTILRCYYCWNC